MDAIFDPNNHYWIVGGDEDSAWSGKEGGYVVVASDTEYLAFLATGKQPSRIANAFELDQVLRQHGMTVGRNFTAEEALDALGRIDLPRLKVALGREDVRPESLVASDADKLRMLAQELMPGSPPFIDGATNAVTLEERIKKLETNKTVTRFAN